jgi:hypothetical protein
MVGIIGDQTEQLGENGEYCMGRLRVIWIINSKLQGGSPRLCRLRPASVGSEMINHLKCTNAYGTYVIPKLSSIVCR